jgi:hypothetical protein
MAACTWPVAVDPIFGCWLWIGPTADNGYPVVREGSREWSHRAVYELEVGAIAPGLVLDHLCRRTKCVAPAHLEPKSKADNELAKSFRAMAARKHCVHGHDLSLTGMWTPERGRVCRTCSRAAA